ncbi:unnamed protein product [Gongylonema pulchrum]|uniref:Proline-rich protein 36-like n=1 Tax=Gongylonema pulchrum TaxID=637853 RepID=A0A183EBS4_9BILA|nr:unnamed protein product [Gongylonema pulchrum]
MNKGVVLVMAIFSGTSGQRQFYNCYLSGDATGHSSWCGDNVKDEVDITDPQAVMEGAMKFAEKQNKLLWDPMTWTVTPMSPAPSPPMPAGEIPLSFAPLFPSPALSHPNGTVEERTVSAFSPISPGQLVSSGSFPGVVASSAPGPLFSAPVVLNTNQILAPSPIILKGLQKTPSFAVRNAKDDSMQTPSASPLAPLSVQKIQLTPDISSTLSEGSNIHHGDLAAVAVTKLPVTDQNLLPVFGNSRLAIPKTSRGAAVQQATNHTQKLTMTTGRRAYKINRFSRFPKLFGKILPTSIFKSRNATTELLSDLKKRNHFYGRMLLPASHSEKPVENSVNITVRRFLTPTRLTLNRSPAAFTSREGPNETDEHKQQLASSGMKAQK